MSAGLSLFAPLLGAPAFRELERRVAAGERGVAVSGLVEGARALALTLLAARTGRRLLVAVPDDAAVETWRRDLAAFASLAGRDARRILTCPALDADPWNGIAPHAEAARERVRREMGTGLTELADGEHSVVVTVYDDAGHSASDTATFSVETSIFALDGPAGPWVVIGMVVALLAVIGVAGFMLYRRKNPPAG